MAITYWTIAKKTTDEVLQAVFMTNGEHPKDAGWKWDPSTQRAFTIPAIPDLTVQVLIGTTWTDDAAKVQTLLISSIKAEAEARKMKVFSSGGAKKTEYADKMREVVAFESLGGTLTAMLSALALIPPDIRALRFAHVYADAAAFGDTPQAAVARFKAGIASSGSVATIAAAEAKACADIRAATTAAAKKTKASAVKWPAGS